jgi:hypothetical protein
MWAFTKIWADADTKRIARAGLQRLNDALGEDFVIPLLLFGRVIVHRATNVWLLPICTQSRPPRKGLIAVTVAKPQTYLLPMLIPEDFFQCCDLLKVASLEDLASFYELVHSGANVRRPKPRIIRTPQDAVALGIRPDLLPPIIESKRLSTWWQPWGGILYQLEVDRALKRIMKTEIGHEVGTSQHQDALR